MDCAKGIGVVSSNHRSILAFEGVDQIPLPMPPLICIPTTAGTSADVSQFAIITDLERRVKSGIVAALAQKGGRSCDIADLARNAVRDACMATNPRPVNVRDIEVVYEESL